MQPRRYAAFRKKPTVDPKEKRKRVMARSIKLGHCVCDPRKPCPCPLFKEKDVCTCAGERVPTEDTGEAVRLTQFVRSAGCASKISQKDLHQVLKMLPAVQDPRLLVGTATADDAGVFKLTDQVTVVQTVDVFTPGVDDPRLFGKIAACNSLSDVYAMGGKPMTALSVIGFPIYSLAHEVMAEILRGGMDVLEEAGTILLGGHSINDEEIKFGFAVTGVIETSKLITNAGAEPGNVLVLTKPLGTGIVSLAHQLGKASDASREAIARSMSALNRAASEIMVDHGAAACTDVTGFGILGHLCQMVVESKVTAEIWMDSLPLFPGVLEYAEQGMFSGANERNAEYSADRTEFLDDIPDGQRAILFDAQTSGGLLVAVSEERAGAMVEAMHGAGVESATIIGKVTDVSDGRIRVRKTGEEKTSVSAKSKKAKPKKESPMTAKKKEKSQEDACCSHGSGTSDQAIGMFMDFMGTAMQPGAVDVVTKQLMAVALSLAVNCVPCSRIHIKKARDMGISNEELEEAASLAVCFAGCRPMMLWNQLKKEML
jgi:selenide,water dikinase